MFHEGQFTVSEDYELDCLALLVLLIKKRLSVF